MTRGGSTEFRFKLPHNFSDLAVVKITFWQEGYYGLSESRPLPIVKTREQCRVGSSLNELSVTLNQEETLRFTDRKKGKVQLYAKTIAGQPIMDKERLFTVYPVYDDSIIDDNMVPTPSPEEWLYFDGQDIM
jgi:hypothetical protein